jgi:hypothetical protein
MLRALAVVPLDAAGAVDVDVVAVVAPPVADVKEATRRRMELQLRLLMPPRLPELRRLLPTPRPSVLPVSVGSVARQLMASRPRTRLWLPTFPMT